MPQYLPSRRPGRTAEYSLAEVAELADAHGSGPCARKGVGVRVPSSAPLIFPPLALSAQFEIRTNLKSGHSSHSSFHCGFLLHHLSSGTPARTDPHSAATRFR